MNVRVAVLALTLLPVTAFTQALDPIAGAWEQVSVKNATTGQMQQLTPPNLHMIFIDGNYVQFTAAAGRAKIAVPIDKMTREQLLERLNLQGQFGTYRIVGNKVIRQVVSAGNPINEGREVTMEYRVEGDTLVLIGANVDGVVVENRYRRLRPPAR
jgi:hypothetical protein